MEEKSQEAQNPAVRFLNRLFVFVDDVVLVIVAFMIILVAAILLYEAATDFVYYSAHTVAHITSDLMFVLIIMELFRQVLRQINRQVFSLNPFIFIGVIASVRGLLITQIALAMGEIEWKEGVVKLAAHAVIVLILMVCYFFYVRAGKAGD